MEGRASTPITGCYTLQREVYQDHRGHFSELFRSCDFEEKFVQRNVSLSKKNVLRGMHSMWSKPQGKLVSCLYGKVWDVVFDARLMSPTFMKGYAIELDYQKLNAIYVPPGCLHGFLTLSDVAVVEYDCTTYYQQKYDGGAKWDSLEIKKLFPPNINPVLSSKDEKLPTLTEFLRFKK